ncbi:ead/Ea22-like family protein [Shigella flexneri]|uniref:ead/Ea22-like family protein n=1 Tax=Shigella flexneri TaxID=623 RepID=UPI003FD8F1A0
MSEINSQSLREAAEQAMHDNWGFDADLFHELVTPSIVLELLDERERNQQYIKRRDQENEDIALTVGKLRVELETAKSKLNEQREYYEGVISDGSKRIAKLESNEVREDGNQFLVVRHPGKTPVIKHCTGDLEEFLRQLIEQDPLVTIDIITHRYYGVGGQLTCSPLISTPRC